MSHCLLHQPASGAPDHTPGTDAVAAPALHAKPGTAAATGRQGFSIADDLATHEIVLFGGVGDYANTWLWDGSKWTLAHPQTSPGPRLGASEAYDARTRTVLLFGGRLEPGTPVDDTWAWNGTTWGELDSGTGGPQPGEGSDMAWDSALMQMVVLTRSGVLPAQPAAPVGGVDHGTGPGDRPRGAVRVRLGGIPAIANVGMGRPGVGFADVRPAAGGAPIR